MSKPLQLRPGVHRFGWMVCVLSGVVLLAATGWLSPVMAGSDKTVNEWLTRMHEAGRNRTYLGTYVVSNNLGISSSRIWHACDGVQQLERVEALTGTARTTIRHNDQVVTFTPGNMTALVEKRESLGLFPNILQSAAIPEHYSARLSQTDRVAGLHAQVLELVAKDKWRYGYRIWVEKETGLVIKLQTLDLDGQVLEESAFSEIQLNAPVKIENIAKLMKANTDESRGVKVTKPDVVKTTAAAMGWSIKSLVPGFQPMSCYKRAVADIKDSAQTMQWVFSDGLATVSIFAQTYDSQKHGQEMAARLGSTQTLSRRLDAWWLTLMGEVPSATLKTFADGIERKK